MDKITIELFSGSKSFSKVAAQNGYKTLTVDIIKEYSPDICKDILQVTPEELGKPLIIWASPPCTTFSVLSIGKHFHYDGVRYYPKTDKCKLNIALVEKTIKLISELKPKYFFIENPTGALRKIIRPLFDKYKIKYNLVNITYCQYGFNYRKPTDIFTNLPAWLGKKCKNGNPCHVGAPRGSKSGLRALENAHERAKIPEGLFIEIFRYIDKNGAQKEITPA